MQRFHSNAMRIRRMTMIGLFTALAYVVMMLIHFPVPPMLTLDLKDTVITLCGLCFGPLAAVFAGIVVPLLELITVSDTGVYGFVMNALGALSFSVTVSLIYKFKKNMLGAILGLVSGVFAMTAVMLLFNLIVTPLYLHISVAEVRQMIPTLLLPFNLVKAVLNASMIMLLYKPVSSLLQRTGFLPHSEHTYRLDWRTVTAIAVSVVLIVSAFVVVFAVLGGQFTFGWAA